MQFIEKMAVTSNGLNKLLMLALSKVLEHFEDKYQLNRTHDSYLEQL